MVVEVVMNHMGNEFYFEGYQSSHAPWRFHEDNGLREYQLKFRKERGEAARQLSLSLRGWVLWMMLSHVVDKI